MTADDPLRSFSEDHFTKGFPWCTVCHKPAVWSESWGALHVTPLHPWGQPHGYIKNGHRADISEWARTDAPAFPPDWGAR